MNKKIHLPKSSQDIWRYWFSLDEIKVTNSNLLQVDSQYLGAKDPGELVCKLKIDLSDGDLVELHKYIGEYIKKKSL